MTLFSNPSIVTYLVFAANMLLLSSLALPLYLWLEGSDERADKKQKQKMIDEKIKARDFAVNVALSKNLK